jgi:hypothetical protein
LSGFENWHIFLPRSVIIERKKLRAQGHHKGATQIHKRKHQEQKKTTYDLAYAYGTEQPHAPIHIGEQTYTYDANGNQTGWTSDVSGQRRAMMWDEENRLRAVYDNGALYHYVYDASGQRVLKGQSTGQRIFVNGEGKPEVEVWAITLFM